MTGSRLGRRGLEVDGVEVVTDYHHLSGYGDRSGGPRRVLPSTEVAGWRVVMGKGDRRKSRRCGPLYKYGRPGRDIAPTSRA
jgi:hypothetical protein